MIDFYYIPLILNKKNNNNNNNIVCYSNYNTQMYRHRRLSRHTKSVDKNNVGTPIMRNNFKFLLII